MPKNELITYTLSEPLPEATSARIDIHAGDGNLEIDALAAGEPLLAGGSLQYFRKQGLPGQTLEVRDGQAILTLQGGKDLRPRFRMPWSASNGGTEWRVHLNPALPADICARSSGGNLRLDLSGMAVTRLSAESGGGNLDVVLPERAADLDVIAKTGAGDVNVTIGRTFTGSSTVSAHSGAGSVVVRLPGSLAARIHTHTGMGKATVDPCFPRLGDALYQSPGYEQAADTVEITVDSGMGDVSVLIR